MPTYFDVLNFHEIDSGEVGEESVQMYERTGAEIAPYYREYMRFAGSALKEYLYRSPKRVAEMINERMASPPSGCSGSRAAAIPTPWIL